MSDFVYFNYIPSGIKIIPCKNSYFNTLFLEGEIE